jgi:hypothetical protein
VTRRRPRSDNCTVTVTIRSGRTCTKQWPPSRSAYTWHRCLQIFERGITRKNPPRSRTGGGFPEKTCCKDGRCKGCRVVKAKLKKRVINNNSLILCVRENVRRRVHPVVTCWCYVAIPTTDGPPICSTECCTFAHLLHTNLVREHMLVVLLRRVHTM